MSNPLTSLKRNKKPPLFLPEMLDASTTPRDQPRELAGSSLSNYYSGYNSQRRTSNASNSTESNLPRKSFALNELPSSRVPFKNKIDESDLMDEVTTQMAISNLKRNIVKTNVPVADSTPNDMDLMQLMMGKIKRTEARCAIFEKDCKEKDNKILSLERKLELLKKADDTSVNTGSASVVYKLEKENFNLRSKVHEMEKFLRDYGLHWIGDNEQEQQETTQLNNEFQCDYDLIVKNISELNSMADYNEAQIVESVGGAKFETTKSIQLTLFSNGIALYSGPFRSFKDPLTKKFCIDLMDGYFPSELENRFPDGVPFNLVDKRDVIFNDDKKGYRLGSSNLNEKPLTIQQFLDKLPPSVINDGKIIGIRNDISNLLTEEVKSDPCLIETPALNDTNEHEDAKIATLRIKSLSSEESTYLIKIYYTDTIQTLKNHLVTHRKNLGVIADFDLATMFPRKIFKSMDSTLEENGLSIPKSNILLIPRK